MRIVAGRFKGTQLHAPKSQATRPTSDRLRESLFNILAHGHDAPFEGARVLDLFAGSGALGLEALSRGARYCLFVEDASEARAAIRRNIEACHATGDTKIWRRDATKLGRCAPMEPFDLAFLDPPYGKGLGVRALQAAREGGWLKAGALCVLEETAEVEIAAPDGFALQETRRQGGSQIAFLTYS